MWKVELRTTCKICDAPITNKRSRTYCSVKCRQKFYNTKYAQMHADWQRKRQDAKASVASNKKLKCAICSRWYIQVGTHVTLRHGITAREYREQFGLPVKRGIVPKWYREAKGEQAIENKTFKNLGNGAPHRFTKGDKRASIKAGKVGWKSQRRKPDELYQ